MLTEKELLERALKGLANLTKKPVPPAELVNAPDAGFFASEGRAAPGPELSRIPPEFADALTEFQEYFSVRSVRVAGPKDRGIPYAQWKARELNRIFAQHGTGGPAHITARAVAHGQDKESQRLTKKETTQNGPTTQ